MINKIFSILIERKILVEEKNNKIFSTLIERKILLILVLILVEEKYNKIFSILIERKILFNSTLSIKYKIIKS